MILVGVFRIKKTRINKNLIFIMTTDKLDNN